MTPSVLAFKSWSLEVDKLYTAPHDVKKIIQRNIEPSWALQIDEIL
jgi:hypothetical protein